MDSERQASRGKSARSRRLVALSDGSRRRSAIEKWTAGGDLESDAELEHVLTELAFLHAASRERGLRVTVSEHVSVVTLKRLVVSGGELLEIRQRACGFLELRTGGSEVFEDLLHFGTCFGEACVIL